MNTKPLDVPLHRMSRGAFRKMTLDQTLRYAAITFLSLASCALAVIGYASFTARQKQVFQDIKLDARFVAAYKDAGGGFVEVSTHSKTVLSSERNVSSMLGYTQDEMAGLFMADVFSEKVVSTDFERDPAIRVYGTYLFTKTNTLQPVILWVVHHPKTKRLVVAVIPYDKVEYTKEAIREELGRNKILYDSSDIERLMALHALDAEIVPSTSNTLPN